MFIDVVKIENKKPCIICNKETHYFSLSYERYICSEDCYNLKALEEIEIKKIEKECKILQENLK